MTERRYDPEGTRTAILEAARAIFVERGLGLTSMTDIAKAAGVTKSLIHHHFGSKEKLWGEVKRLSFERYFGAMLDIIRKEGGARNGPLENAIRFTFQFHRDHPDMTRMMSWMHLEGELAGGPLHERLCTEGLARIRRAQEEGYLRRDVEAAWIQASFLILAGGWFQKRWEFDNWDLGEDEPEGTRDERFLRDMLKIFFDGVLPRPDL